MPWELFGNANATSASWLGTSGETPLTIKTSAQERITISSDGDVRIGSGARLFNVAIGTLIPGIDYHNQWETVGIDNLTGNLRLQSPNRIIFHTGGATPDGVKPIERMEIAEDGSVGIGTPPKSVYRLDVR